MADPKHKEKEQVLNFNGYNLGINLSKSDRQLLAGELLTATNFKYNDFGELETRQGLARVTASALPDSATVKHEAKVTTGSTTYTLLVGSDYKIWYLNGSSVPTSIGTNQTAEGDAQIVQFGDYAVILDGGFIKYWDGGDAGLKMAYDAGTGTDGYTFNNYEDSGIAAWVPLSSVHNRKIGSRITLPTITSGYAYTPLTVSFNIKKYGSPTGNVTCEIYDTSHNLLGTSTTLLDASGVTTSSLQYDFDFSEVTLSPTLGSTDVFIPVACYSDGDASNYIQVELGENTGDGSDYDYTGTGWATSTQQTICKVSPGLPPKAAFGKVHSGRLYCAGDPDHTAYLWYSNANTIFDWSTADGGGFVGVSENDAGNYPIGGILPHYFDLFIIGKQSRPYIAKLTGESPSEYEVVPLFQQCWTDHKCIVSAVNDFWFGSGDGVHAMSGVTEYGDLRSFSEGDPVLSKVKTYFSTASFMGYNPADGQVLLKMSGYANTLVCHTKHAYEDDKGRKRYPWTEYLFAGLTPTSFASWDDTFYVGCSDGHLYSLTNDVNDVSTQPTYTLKPGWVEFPMVNMFMRRLFHEIDSDAAASYKISFYTNGNDTAPVAYCTQTLTDSPMGNKLRFKASSLQWLIDTLTITKPLKIRGFQIKALPLKFAPVSPVTSGTPTSYAVSGTAVYTVTASIVANYDITDDGTTYRYIYFLNSGSTNRSIVPTGTYRAGVEVVIYNTGSAVLTFDPNALNKDILPGADFSPATFSYDGTQWR